MSLTCLHEPMNWVKDLHDAIGDVKEIVVRRAMLSAF
jgi:hypothetical protein